MYDDDFVDDYAYGYDDAHHRLQAQRVLLNSLPSLCRRRRIALDTLASILCSLCVNLCMNTCMMKTKTIEKMQKIIENAETAENNIKR